MDPTTLCFNLYQAEQNPAKHPNRKYRRLWLKRSNACKQLPSVTSIYINHKHHSYWIQSRPNRWTDLGESGTIWKPCSCSVFIAMSHDDMTHTFGTRDEKGMPCASWGPWGPPTGLYGVSADSLGLPDAEYFIGWDMAPQSLAPETKRGRPCASWSHLRGYMGYQ